MSSIDKLKEAWQSQSCGSLELDLGRMLSEIEFQRKKSLYSDLFVIFTLTCAALFFAVIATQDILVAWPWYIATVSVLFVVVIMSRRLLATQASRGRDASLVQHLDEAVAEAHAEIRRQLGVFWWYILPLALACMVPTFLMYITDPLRGGLMVLIGFELFFATTFLFVYLMIRFVGCRDREAYLKKLLEMRKRIEENDEL